MNRDSDISGIPDLKSQISASTAQLPASKIQISNQYCPVDDFGKLAFAL
jgi:hypothetical protein